MILRTIDPDVSEPRAAAARPIAAAIPDPELEPLGSFETQSDKDQYCE